MRQLQMKLNKKKQLVHKRIALVILINLILALCTGCNTQNEIIIYDDITTVSRDVNIENKEELVGGLIECIKGDSDTKINIIDKDIIKNAEVNNYYFFNDAIYLQIDTYMYRFQLRDSNVVSYIKYNLEA